MKTITIEEILNLLPEGDGRQVMTLLMLHATTGDSVTAELIALLAPHREKLEANGMVPEYLAYALPFYGRLAYSQQQDAAFAQAALN